MIENTLLLLTQFLIFEVLTMSTIQVHGNNFCNQPHNTREGSYAKAPHIDPSKTPDNETWRHQTIKDAYHDIFDASVASYNANKRKDRQITDYYKKIEDDKEKNVAYELVVGVYHPVNKKGEPFNLHEFTDEQAKAAIKEYFDTFEQRNPSMRCFGAYYHQDEKGQSHLHLDYIPTACTLKEISKGKQKGKMRGMELENTLSGALKQLGFETKAGTIGTAQTQWEKREAAYFEEICKKHGIQNIRHPRKEKEACLGLDMTEYKRTMEKINQTEIAHEKAEQERQAAADERAAAEQARQEAERAAAEQAERLAQEAAQHAAELRRLRKEHERQLEEEKKDAEKKLAEQRKAHDEQLKFEYENHAEELQRQRREQKEQLAQEWEDTKNAEKAAIRADLANLRTEVFREINEDRRKAEADLQDFKKQADSEKNDIEKDLTRLKLEKSSSEAETAEKKNSLSVVKASLAAANYSIKFAEEAEILPVKPWYSSKLQIAIGDWEKWNNNYRKMRDWWLSNGEKAKKLEGEKSDLQKAVSRKDQKIEDMTEIIKQKNETIAELKKEIAEKDEKISALEKTVTLIKSGFSKALAWFSVKVPDDVSPKLGDAAQDLAERDKFQEFELGERVAACKITVMEDSLGIFGLLEEEGTGRQRIMSKDDLLSATNGFEGNDVKGNWVKLEGFELTEENSFNRYPQKVADYEFDEKQEKSSDGGGGMVLGSKLKEKLLQLEKERTVGD